MNVRRSHPSNCIIHTQALTSPYPMNYTVQPGRDGQQSVNADKTEGLLKKFETIHWRVAAVNAFHHCIRYGRGLDDERKTFHIQSPSFLSLVHNLRILPTRPLPENCTPHPNLITPTSHCTLPILAHPHTQLQRLPISQP